MIGSLVVSKTEAEDKTNNYKEYLNEASYTVS